MTLDKYLSIPEASSLYGIIDGQLYQWIDLGKIKAVMTISGVVVRQMDVAAQLPTEDQPEHKAVAHLKGTPIGVHEGAIKYSVQHSNVSRWIQKGYIAVLGSKPVHGGYQKLIDEADLAYCVAIFKASSRKGKRLFKPSE